MSLDKIRQSKNDLSMAEQQMWGFTAAKTGEDIIQLADGMGLTATEWL